MRARLRRVGHGAEGGASPGQGAPRRADIHNYEMLSITIHIHKLSEQISITIKPISITIHIHNYPSRYPSSRCPSPRPELSIASKCRHTMMSLNCLYSGASPGRMSR